MDVQVTIKISKEALGEAAEVFQQFLNSPQVAQVAMETGTVTEATAEQPAVTPYGQQIAGHFPQANSGAVPTAPAAPTAPVTQTESAVSQAPAVPPTQPVPQPAAPVTPQAPTKEHTYTAEELQMAAVTLVDKGMMAQLQELLNRFGVNALPALPKEQYGAFATALRGMGAQI